MILQNFDLTYIKYQLANLAIRNTIPLQYWKNGISIMLEKKPNNISISKLRAILLLEVDLNTVNKIIFNIRLILILKSNNLILKELISGLQGQSIIHIAINKKLLSDIVN